LNGYTFVRAGCIPVEHILNFLLLEMKTKMMTQIFRQ
jgi:hypothetical protein